jgi:CRP-like cAMP-binding protein
MLDQLLYQLRQDKTKWDKLAHLLKEREIPVKTTLLNEGEIAQYLYFVKRGCLRLWFNNDGKDITFQFFFEKQTVSSIESFLGGQPSLFSLESIEPTTVVVISKEGFDILLNQYPEIKNGFQKIILERMGNYAKLFLSRIKDNPPKRYYELLKHSPEIIQRVPQYYIASYLGITPISLSRIRNKK